MEEAWQCGGGQQAGAGLAGVTDAGVVAGTEGVPGAKPPAVTRRACFWVAAREDKSGEVSTQGQTMNREWLGCAGVSRYVSALDEALWECGVRSAANASISGDGSRAIFVSSCHLNLCT